MKLYKTVFMGTPEFAVPVLERLIMDGHKILAVITQPDKKRGRGKSITYSPIKVTALKHSIEVLQPDKIKRPEFIAKLRDLAPELLITCAYGQILPKSVLDIPEYGCINVHASLLPHYRGAAPIHRAIMNGEKITGITTMMTDIGMDTGDILQKTEVKLGGNTTSGELHDILMYIGADLISKTLRDMSLGKLERIPQNNSEATYAPMLKKEESIIDWKSSAESIHNKVRALNPWPGCFTSYKGTRLRIISSGIRKSSGEKEPGLILKAEKDLMEVACGSDSILIYELQFENKKAMKIEQCWHNIETGIVLGKGGS